MSLGRWEAANRRFSRSVIRSATPRRRGNKLAHLAAVASPHRGIQVVPDAARTYHHLDGPFILATMAGRELAFIESAARGFVIEDRDMVSQLRWRWGYHPQRGPPGEAVRGADREGGAAVDVRWRRSSRSNTQGGACVEVATVPDQVLIRDSKDPDGPRLTIPAADWHTFLRTLR